VNSVCRNAPDLLLIDKITKGTGKKTKCISFKRERIFAGVIEHRKNKKTNNCEIIKHTKLNLKYQLI